MRWLHLTVIVLFAAAILIFAVQNLQVVTTSFLGVSIRTPLAVLVALSSCWALSPAVPCWPCCADPTRERGKGRRSPRSVSIRPCPKRPNIQPLRRSPMDVTLNFARSSQTIGTPF